MLPIDDKCVITVDNLVLFKIYNNRSIIEYKTFIQKNKYINDNNFNVSLTHLGHNFGL